MTQDTSVRYEGNKMIEITGNNPDGSYKTKNYGEAKTKPKMGDSYRERRIKAYIVDNALSWIDEHGIERYKTAIKNEKKREKNKGTDKSIDQT